MAIQVVPYTADRVAGVRQLNSRLEAGGVRWRWYEDPVDYWIPNHEPGQRVWREHYLAVEDGETVLGGYALKPHEFLCRGERHVLTDWQGPTTLAVVDPRYNSLGLRLLREMLRKYPLLYTWGHGEDGRETLEILRRLGWLVFGTPFCLQIVRPSRFLRLNAYLRKTPWRRIGLDLLARSGAGWLGIRALHAALRLRARSHEPASYEVVPRFDAWADELWERCAPHYSVIATRDRETMNLLLPEGGWPSAVRLRVFRDGETLGWAAVLDTQMSGDQRFGNLRVGSVIDALASPEDAPAVVGAACRFLRERGVDMIFSNQSHPAWVQAFADSGFLILPERRFFAASPALQQILEPVDEMRRGLHLTNMDGHGPIRL